MVCKAIRQQVEVCKRARRKAMWKRAGGFKVHAAWYCDDEVDSLLARQIDGGMRTPQHAGHGLLYLLASLHPVRVGLGAA